MTVAREDLALEAAFWAQLPGNFPMRPRKAPITSRNFAAMVPFHNYPAGRAKGNHWGDALTVLVTSARSPFHFSLHASDPSDPEGGSRKDTGHTLICGPTGSGKTVLIGFLVALLAGRAPRRSFSTRIGGSRSSSARSGVSICPLKNGQPTGFNPLQAAADTLKYRIPQELAAGAGATRSRRLSVRQQADLDQALRGTLALILGPAPVPAHRVSGCDRCGGALRAPVRPGASAGRATTPGFLTMARMSWSHGLPATRLVGFDVTDFLDHELSRTPVTLYLFHLVRQLLDGRRLVCWMDEFWRLLPTRPSRALRRTGQRPGGS